MTEIKRWEVDFHGDEFTEHPNGEWVRWEDVKDIIDLARDAVTLKVFQEFERNNDPPPP